jgi:hypothetical protein
MGKVGGGKFMRKVIVGHAGTGNVLSNFSREACRAVAVCGGEDDRSFKYQGAQPHNNASYCLAWS